MGSNSRSQYNRKFRTTECNSCQWFRKCCPYLQVWASSYNPITELDFSNFTALHTIDYYCTSLNTITLHNVPSLKRLCLESCNLSYLDISEAPSLEDLRATVQQSPTYTINWGNTELIYGMYASEIIP